MRNPNDVSSDCHEQDTPTASSVGSYTHHPTRSGRAFRGKWCVACGAEHEDWGTACTFCGSSLVDDPPAPPEPVDHSVDSIDVASLGPDQRFRLLLELATSDVPTELIGDSLTFPAQRRPEADAAILEIEGDGDAELAVPMISAKTGSAGLDGHQDGSHPDARPQLGGIVRRVLAELVGMAGWSVLLASLGLLLDDLELPASAISMVGLAVIVLGNTALVALLGADPGKLLFRLGVVDDSGGWPRWNRALARYLVLLGPYWVLGDVAVLVWGWNRSVGRAIAWTPLVWVVIVVWSIATNPARQGWHDRVARTWVVNARTPVPATAHPAPS